MSNEIMEYQRQRIEALNNRVEFLEEMIKRSGFTIKELILKPTPPKK